MGVDPSKTAFDPSRYLSKVKGSDYLEVRWRLVWLRDQHPDAAIDTDMVSFTDRAAVFKAIVTLPSGAVASGWGTCSATEFQNYVEKAETKAIGRALAALGYGTQFTDDFADGNGPIADAPMQRASDRQPTPLRDNRSQQVSTPGGASQAQVNAIFGIGKALGWDRTSIVGWVQNHFQREIEIDELTKADASHVIEELNKIKDGQR